MARNNRAVRHAQIEPGLSREQKARAKREDREQWERHIPMTEKQAGAILGCDLPGNVRYSMEFEGGGLATFMIFDKERVFSDCRSVDFGKKTLLSGYLKCNDQGKGIGRTVLRNQIEFFRACGIRTFEISAGLDAGGYTWARFGFLPEKINGTHFDDHTRQHVRKRYEAIESILTEDEKRDLSKMIRLRHRRDIWNLADAKIDVGPRLRSLFNEKAKGEAKYREPLKQLFNVLASDEPAIRNNIEKRLAVGETVPVGRLFLAGAYWDGVLNFDNKEQMKRAGDYVGGWKCKPASGKPPKP